MYDLHTHTTFSDGKDSVDTMCRSAIAKGLSGLAITDHADMYAFEKTNTPARMQEALAAVSAAKTIYRDSLKLLGGVELGEYAMAPEKAETILALKGLDVVLYSEHYVPSAKWQAPYSRIVFDETIRDDEIRDYMARYFETVAKTVDLFDFDVLGHLTCPARYITGRYHRPTDVMLCKDTVTDILKSIIARDIALEINTCGKCCESFSYYDAQNEEILALYVSLGGHRVTLGSDAHAQGGVGRGFEEAKAMLRRYGLDGYYYYENRLPVKVAI